VYSYLFVMVTISMSEPYGRLPRPQGQGLRECQDYAQRLSLSIPQSVKPRTSTFGCISPFPIVSHLPSSLSFYRDRLGFEITFQGPDPDDIFFGIVRRGGAQILFKDVGVAPMPNYTRDIKKGIARWDAATRLYRPCEAH
jgi:hypothetical protein